MFILVNIFFNGYFFVLFYILYSGACGNNNHTWEEDCYIGIVGRPFTLVLEFIICIWFFPATSYWVQDHQQCYGYCIVK